jgi:microcystin-dependent protein
MDSPFYGMVQYFAFNFAPRGYATCSGQLVSIASNAALFSLLGTYYGGNGTTTFALPDLRGRSVVGQSGIFTMGEVFGSPTATLLTSNMPSHTHTATGQIPVNSATGTTTDPTNANPAGAKPARGAHSMYTDTPGASQFLGTPNVTVGVAGNTVPFSVLNPYLAVTATITLQGIYPSRN